MIRLRRRCRGLRRSVRALEGKEWRQSWRVRAYSTSALTKMTPRAIIPSAFAAPIERSRTRPRPNGPRSLTTTITLWPLAGLVTRRRKASPLWRSVLNVLPLGCSYLPSLSRWNQLFQYNARRDMSDPTMPSGEWNSGSAAKLVGLISSYSGYRSSALWKQ